MDSLRAATARFAFVLASLVICAPTFAGTSFAPGVRVGTISNASVTEASGIVASRSNANVLWVHNDSGDSARVFAMTPSGTNLGTYSITGAGALDWEDIAVGPGPVAGSQYLYIGDIGDNLAFRSSISIYRVPEPLVSSTQSPVTTSLSGASKLTFAYPDGPRDAESLFVDPLTRDIYILTKRENPHRLYRAPYPQATSGTTTLQLVTTYADPNWLTAADISPDGDEIIARATGATSGRLFVRPPGGTIADALNSAPITIPLVPESQGEAIGFDPSGWGYYTISEGSNSPITYFNRLPSPGDFNRDGVIDAADYAIMRKTDATQNSYNTWRAHFGEASSAGPAHVNGVPEPSTISVGFTGAVMMLYLRLARRLTSNKSRS